MAYTVLARKYRPQTFADLVGQEHVTRTLGNAIRSERVAHAFLFTGVRGVGKTTTARILAKALNCEKGPTPEPCGVCDACVDIAAGRDTDVHEMDGASNNSVEDVRRLQESLPYRPSRDRFKIVIVDEVHMLSTGAFNALLKTLEEPPDHVKFILATTEIHKVPVTIRSRCQRYDFRLIPQSVVADAVREILDAEGVKADDAAVGIVAREAAGSMRDAQTLLDQIVAFGGADLKGEEVARVLGIADREAVHRVAAAVLGGDGGAVLEQVDGIASHGLDMLHFARQLLELFRDMVVLQVAGAQTDLVAMVDEERRRATESGASVDLQELQRAFSGLSKVVDDVAQSGTPRTTLEMGLVRLATRPPLLPLAELVARLDAIDKRGGGGGGGGARRSGSGGRAGASGGAPVRASGAAQSPASTSSAARAEDHGAGADEPRTLDDVAPASARVEATAPKTTGASGATANGATRAAAEPAPSRSHAQTPRPSANASSAEKDAPRAHAEAPIRAMDAPRPEASAASTERTAARTDAPRDDSRRNDSQRDDSRRNGSRRDDSRRNGSRRDDSRRDDSRRDDSQRADSQRDDSQRADSQRNDPRPTGAPADAPAAATDSAKPAAPPGGRPAATQPPSSFKAAGSDPSSSVDGDAWARIVASVMDGKPALGAVLQHGAPLAVNAEKIVLAFPRGSFFGRQAEALDGRQAIEETAERVLGARPTVEVTYVDGDAAESAKTLVQADNERRAARIEATRQKALSHPLVVEAAQLFRVAPERMKVRVELE